MTKTKKTRFTVDIECLYIVQIFVDLVFARLNQFQKVVDRVFFGTRVVVVVCRPAVQIQFQ